MEAILDCLPLSYYMKEPIDKYLVDIINPLIPDEICQEAQDELEHLSSRISTGLDKKSLDLQDMKRLIALLEYKEKNEDVSGFHKWFVPGTPYGIDKLPKHREFFKSTASHTETLMLGGNRCGKTRAGATVSAILATGQYPDWWEGVRFRGPVSIWAAGKTGQSTRDSVQEAVLGPIGSWGTGALPLNTIGRTTARQGVASAIDTVEVVHISGGISTIGFKSYDQKPASFYGTAKHLVWLDEPCPELVYNECLIRTMTTGGRLIHTITPKEGLTRLLADFLKDCELLAGTERVKGLEAIGALEELDSTDDYGFKES